MELLEQRRLLTGPTAVEFENTTTTLPENTSTAVSIKVADIAVVDPDGVGTNLLSLAGEDAALFDIVGTELHVKAGVILDFEGESSLEVTVNADDPGEGGFPDAFASFTLTLGDVNEPPSVSLENVLPSIFVGADLSAGLKVADIVIVDDALGTEGLSLSGSDSVEFEIVGTELRLKPGTVLNAVLNPFLDVTVSVDDVTVGVSPDDSDILSLPVIFADTAVTTDGDGNLVIEDNTLLGSDDLLTITADNTNSKFIIHDPNKEFGTDIAGATISPDGHSIEVPFSAVPGPKVVVDTALGNDSATFNALGGPFSKGLDVDAGLGIDVVTIGSPVNGGLADISIINAETINLLANLSTDGGDVSLEGAVVLKAPTVTIDTEAGNNGNAGNVDLTGTIAGDNNTRNLVIDASSTGGTGGGAVVLDSNLSNAPATELVSLNLTSTGTATISGDINTTQDVTVTAGNVDITGAINAGGMVTLQPFGVAVVIDLGSNTPGRFGITDAELDLIAGSPIVVGNSSNVALIIETATISQSGKTLELISVGDITRTVGELQADELSMQAGGKIGDSAVRMRTNVTNLEAEAGATGIFITEADAVVVGGVSAALTGLTTTAGDGPIHLITGGAMSVMEAIAVSGTGDVTLQSFTGAIGLGADISTTGDVAVVAGGAITRSAGCIEGQTAALDGTAIGTSANRVCTQVGNLEAHASAGGVFITEIDAVTLGGVSALTGLQGGGANGIVHLISAGAQTVAEAITAAGMGAVILQSYSGAIALGADVTTAGDAAIVAGGAITRTAGTVSADNLVLDALSNIGTMANRVQTAATNLDAVAGGAGMFLAEANAIEIGGASAGLTGLATRAGNTAIDLQANGAIIVSEVVRSTGTGPLRLAATGGDLTINAGMASTSGNVTLNANGAGADVAVNVAVGSDSGQIGITAAQNVAIGSHVIATNNTATVTAAGAITRTAGFVKGQAAALDAGTNIGSSSNRVWTQVSNLEARAMNGGLFITEADGVTIGGVSAGLTGLQTNAANGPIHLITAGPLAVIEAIEANGTGDITLQSFNNTIALSADLTTAGDAAIVAGGAITHTAGTITSDDLTLVASTNVGASVGATRIQTSVNRLEAFAGDGGIFVTEADGLTLGGIGNILPLGLHANGANSDIELLVSAGALAIGDGIRTDVNGTTRLRAAGDITQTGGIVTNMLGVVSDTGTINLSAGTNGVSEFAARSAAAGKSVYYQDLDDLAVNTVGAGGIFAGLVNGVSAGHDVELLSVGNLALQRAIQAGAGATDAVRLKSETGSVTQNLAGAITGTNLSVQAGTIIDLSAAINDVDVFAAAAGAAPVQFNDPDGNTIGTVAGGVLITNSVTGVTP